MGICATRIGNFLQRASTIRGIGLRPAADTLSRAFGRFGSPWIRTGKTRQHAMKRPAVPAERRRHARARSALPPLTINLAEAWQVRWWCEHFGVTHRVLFEAIAAVGLSAVAVREHLERR